MLEQHVVLFSDQLAAHSGPAVAGHRMQGRAEMAYGLLVQVRHGGVSASFTTVMPWHCGLSLLDCV